MEVAPDDIQEYYRLVILTSVLDKKIESFIADRIVDHLETNNLLGNSNHGFRCTRLCLTTLIGFFYHIV